MTLYDISNILGTPAKRLRDYAKRKLYSIGKLPFRKQDEGSDYVLSAQVFKVWYANRIGRTPGADKKKQEKLRKAIMRFNNRAPLAVITPDVSESLAAAGTVLAGFTDREWNERFLKIKKRSVVSLS